MVQNDVLACGSIFACSSMIALMIGKLRPQKKFASSSIESARTRSAEGTWLIARSHSRQRNQFLVSPKYEKENDCGQRERLSTSYLVMGGHRAPTRSWHSPLLIAFALCGSTASCF